MGHTEDIQEALREQGQFRMPLFNNC